MEYKADVCRVDNSRLSAWRQVGWLAPCNTFHYTAAESAIGHWRGQSWVRHTARHIHFPGDMSRWTEMGESGCAWDRDPGWGEWWRWSWEIFDIQTLIEQFTDSAEAFLFFIATYDFLRSKNQKLKTNRERMASNFVIPAWFSLILLL